MEPLFISETLRWLFENKTSQYVLSSHMPALLPSPLTWLGFKNASMLQTTEPCKHLFQICVFLAWLNQLMLLYVWSEKNILIPVEKGMNDHKLAILLELGNGY